MSDELPEILPCPWCCMPAHAYKAPDRDGFYVSCTGSKCAAAGPDELTRPQVIETWNAIAALPARVAALEAALAERDEVILQIRERLYREQRLRRDAEMRA